MKYENIIKTLQKLSFEEAIPYLVGCEQMTKKDKALNAAIIDLILTIVEG